MTALTHPHGQDHDHTHHEEEQASRDQFGFWLYILTDCLIFATLFATYAVMAKNFAGKTEPHEVFDLAYVAVETVLLLLSSFTFGLAMLAMRRMNQAKLKLWLYVTFLLGAGFITMELHEFHHLAREGVTPQLSGYWSIFFSLIGTHGLHVSAGLIWMIVMVIALNKIGLTAANRSRIAMLSLFWHFLDIIWICVFSFVYLLGAFA